MVVRISFLTIVSLLVITGYSSLGYATQPIDINNPDPNLWESIQEELRERDSSRQTIGYFTPGKEVLEFRAVSALTDKENQSGFEWMETSKKDRLLVSLNALIDSNDIYGILIEKTAYNGNEQYTITLHFRPESYDKIREVTGQLIKKRLAIVRGSTILTAPVVLEALTSYATIPTDFDFLDKFKEGLVPIDQASIETWNKRTIEWLEEKIKKNSDDTEMLVWLAREYNKNNPKDCEKTISLFEKNILANPALIMYARAAHGCYRFLKQYERALNFYKMTLSIIKDKIDEVDIRTMIIEIYGLKGDMQGMIDEAEQNLRVMKEIPLPSFDFLPEGPGKERFIKEMRMKQEQAIKGMEDRIQKAKSELKQGQEKDSPSNPH